MAAIGARKGLDDDLLLNHHVESSTYVHAFLISVGDWRKWSGGPVMVAAGSMRSFSALIIFMVAGLNIKKLLVKREW